MTAMIVPVLIIVLSAVAASLGFAIWDNKRDDRKYPAPGPDYTLPSARETRAGQPPHPAGLPGASPDDEIDQWLADLKKKDDGAFLAAPLPNVPGRMPPAVSSPDDHAGGSAPVSTVTETARPAGDPWKTLVIPAAQHQQAKELALDYMPRVPFANWESDTFVEGLAAIKDGA